MNNIQCKYSKKYQSKSSSIATKRLTQNSNKSRGGISKNKFIK